MRRPSCSAPVDPAARWLVPPSLSALTLAALALAACGDESLAAGGAAAEGGSGGAAAGGGQGEGGVGGQSASGGAPATDLDDLLARLRADRDGTLLEESLAHGWPVLVREGRVVVSADPALAMVTGDFNDWQPAPLTADQGFAWGLVPDAPGDRYKLTDGTATFLADPWSRGYAYDDLGEISLVPSASSSHLERFFQVGDSQSLIEPRVVRVYVPEGTPSHVLYAHDGQNLFDPGAIWGGWAIEQAALPGMMIVGIDNSAARMDEYTQVADDIGSGPVGGLGDAYADYVDGVVRPLIEDQYGVAPKVGVLGSSLGGLISLHIALSYPGRYDFVGSMSGTLGWGSIGPHTGETLIEHYAAAAVQPFVVYLDSGGNGPCADSDLDGIDDDGAGSDNYCETVQLRDVLAGEGYVFDQNLVHWHEPNAPHNEQAWRERVFRPLDVFGSL